MEESMVIGIVGGMGSYATVDLFRRIIDAFPARYEWDRPRVLIDNRCTMPSRVRAILYNEGRPELVAMLAESAKNLIDAGATHLVFACNTSHVFLEEVYEQLPEARERTINIIELCGQRMHEQGIRSCYLLATEGTIAVGVYQQVFERLGIEVTSPSEQEQVLLRDFIEVVKQNKVDAAQRQRLYEYIEGLGQDHVILGCTELPVLYGDASTTLGTTTVHDPLTYAIKQLTEAYQR